MKLLLLLSLLFVLPGMQVALAQYKQHQAFNDYYTSKAIGGERVSQRFYIGAGKHLATGITKFHYIGPDGNGGHIESDYERKLWTARSFVLHIGTFFPITLITDNSALALNTELLFSYAEMDYDSIEFYPKAVFHKPIPYVIVGIPASIEYKSGCDISLSRQPRPMFAVGAGVVLGLSTPAAIVQQSELPLTAIPFVKLEAGLFAGLAFKVRVVAYLRNAINISDSFRYVYDNDQIDIKLRAGYGYHFSLIIMPFSYHWR